MALAFADESLKLELPAVASCFLFVMVGWVVRFFLLFLSQVRFSQWQDIKT